jgi:hypothetical protein
MAETLNGILEERRGLGQKLYVEGMALSGPDKARILPYIKDGRIVEGGPGSGVVTELIRQAYPDSTINAVDISDDMIRRLHEKFAGDSKVNVVKHDIVNYDPGFLVDSYVHVSNIHEVFSVGGYEAVYAMLRNEYRHTRSGGVIDIRDGVQPPPEIVFVKPKTDFGAERFFKFIEGFKAVRNVKFQIGTVDPETLHWIPGKSGSKIDIGKSFIKMNSWSASELFSKYHYPEINLPVELTERFCIWTLDAYEKALEKVGYKITHAETYLIPYLLENHYAMDFDYYHLKDGVISNAPYPPSTMLLVGEK